MNGLRCNGWNGSHLEDCKISQLFQESYAIPRAILDLVLYMVWHRGSQLMYSWGEHLILHIRKVFCQSGVAGGELLQYSPCLLAEIPLEVNGWGMGEAAGRCVLWSCTNVARSIASANASTQWQPPPVSLLVSWCQCTRYVLLPLPAGFLISNHKLNQCTLNGWTSPRQSMRSQV